MLDFCNIVRFVRYNVNSWDEAKWKISLGWLPKT
jgi:hypothetical protein